jgi:hypothetical protein
MQTEFLLVGNLIKGPISKAVGVEKQNQDESYYSWL